MHFSTFFIFIIFANWPNNSFSHVFYSEIIYMKKMSLYDLSVEICLKVINLSSTMTVGQPIGFEQVPRPNNILAQLVQSVPSYKLSSHNVLMFWRKSLFDTHLRCCVNDSYNDQAIKIFNETCVRPGHLQLYPTQAPPLRHLGLSGSLRAWDQTFFFPLQDLFLTHEW